ncbi:DUF6055 domain-containing protein [Caminibacter mediatlanticus]|uniref:Uncharacterized protein n=1 Tax=Caminibacter mediatlanticus TB-2 TaxID=391592 RepID=A0AAI9F1F2_9BACT|nr:DUF6055 domain-containing protein [Caminibacter mediatlanticus]EDM23642.1 hypothetical protein CMTB2_05137 [Caminibacter mediatlanticus TB-2]
MRLFFIFFIFFTFVFGVKDYVLRPSKTLSKTLYSIVINYPESLSSQIDSDEYNIFKYQGHFRVIYGKSYENNETINALANNILNIANEVWDKEVVEFGFKAPRNSDKYYIDIYIGNTGAFNKAENSYINISSSYAGYATSYSDYTPYFVVNPKMSLNLVKVTIVHEFFHTIQYAYGVDIVSDYIWNKNLWFLEATATMMEDEIFDDMNDYINYLRYYLPYINYSIDYTNGMIEYRKVLFAKFLKNKFGIKFIKSIFENYQTTETFLEDIQKEVVFYNETFDDVILEYGVCLANIHICYKDGDNFEDVTTYMLGTNKNAGYYGIVLFSSGSDSYLISSTPYYLQSDFNGNKNILESINDKGLVFVSKKESLNTDFLNYNVFKGYSLKKGWNLISNIFDESIDLSDFNVRIIWALKNGKYCAFSNDTNLNALIKQSGYECSENLLNAGEGIWVYVDDDKNISVNKYNLFKYQLDKGIKGFSAVISPNELGNVTVWYYQDGNCSYYSSNNYYNYQKLDKLLPGRGYFIFKE